MPLLDSKHMGWFQLFCPTCFQIVNFDDVIDFDEINGLMQRSHFLSGPNKTSLKVFIVITPLSKFSTLWSKMVFEALPDLLWLNLQKKSYKPTTWDFSCCETFCPSLPTCWNFSWYLCCYWLKTFCVSSCIFTNEITGILKKTSIVFWCFCWPQKLWFELYSKSQHIAEILFLRGSIGIQERASWVSYELRGV